MEKLGVEMTSESHTLYFVYKEAFERNSHSLLQANASKHLKIVPLNILNDSMVML